MPCRHAAHGSPGLHPERSVSPKFLLQSGRISKVACGFNVTCTGTRAAGMEPVQKRMRERSSIRSTDYITASTTGRVDSRSFTRIQHRPCLLRWSNHTAPWIFRNNEQVRQRVPYLLCVPVGDVLCSFWINTHSITHPRAGLVLTGALATGAGCIVSTAWAYASPQQALQHFVDSAGCAGSFTQFQYIRDGPVRSWSLRVVGER